MWISVAVQADQILMSNYSRRDGDAMVAINSLGTTDGDDHGSTSYIPYLKLASPCPSYRILSQLGEDD
jgi:hypothetical protein